jgi:hypothetical protein
MMTPEQSMTYWTVFAWYMGGAVLRSLWGWMTWFGTTNGDAAPWRKQAARSVQTIIGSVIVAFVWVGSHLWNLLEWVNVDVPFQVAATPLSSLAAGFVLEIILVERLVKKLGVDKTPKE